MGSIEILVSAIRIAQYFCIDIGSVPSRILTSANLPK